MPNKVVHAVGGKLQLLMGPSTELTECPHSKAAGFPKCAIQETKDSCHDLYDPASEVTPLLLPCSSC